AAAPVGPPHNRWLMRVTATAFVILLGINTWLLFFYDSPPVNDSTTVPHWSDRGGADNPLSVFFTELQHTSFKDFNNLSAAERSAADGSEEAGRTFLASQTATFAAIDKLLASDPSTWQWPGGDAIASFTSPLDHALQMVTIINILRLKSRMLCRDKEFSLATELGLSLAKLGHGLSLSEGLSLHHLVAVRAHTTAFTLLEQTLSDGDAPDDVLKAAQAHLTHFPTASRAAFAFALQGEYLSFKRILPQVSREGLGKLSDGTTPGPAFLGHRIKPNQTLTLYLTHTQPLLECLDQSWLAAFSVQQRLDQDLARLRNEAKNLSCYMDANFGGKALLLISLPVTARVLERCMMSEAWHGEVLIMIGMRRFELQHGRLPDKLDELVPDYLATVPEDPFNRVPLRWNSEFKAVYSLGSNCTDEGGAIDSLKRSNGKDMGGYYWWSAEAKSAREQRERDSELQAAKDS
ncbi:MAG: hypothetical protein ACAI34_00950, partial [Verrucomicrobium sp.]